MFKYLYDLCYDLKYCTGHHLILCGLHLLIYLLTRIETLKPCITYHECYNSYAFTITTLQLIDKRIFNVSLLWTIQRFYSSTLTSPSRAWMLAPRQLRAFHYSYNDISLRDTHYAPVLCYLSYCMACSLLNFKKTTPLSVYSNSISEQYPAFFIT
jgi:hypothetical protein